MNRRSMLVGMLSATVAVASFAGGAWADDAFDAEFKKQDARVNGLMDAYNAKNWKKFYVGWADQVKALQTEQVFTALYTNQAHSQFGAYKSRTLNREKSTFNDVVGLLVYDAQFAKKKGTLSVNFFKENGEYKFQQVRIDP